MFYETESKYGFICFTLVWTNMSALSAHTPVDFIFTAAD